MQITGIGGFFFRAVDPEKLAAWYSQHFGITSGGAPWMQQAGPRVLAPFRKESDYFPTNKSCMLNLRTDDLTAHILALAAAGIAVETRAEWDGEWGSFVRVHDPEGNPIELWQPP
jgi:predicted enzyme related to lactoylglutathione lyase